MQEVAEKIRKGRRIHKSDYSVSSSAVWPGAQPGTEWHTLVRGSRRVPCTEIGQQPHSHRAAEFGQKGVSLIDTPVSGGATFSHISIPALAGANAAISSSDTIIIALSFVVVKHKSFRKGRFFMLTF